jgi:hypothetical protein
MYFIHILFGILHVGVWVALVTLWLLLGVFVNKPLLDPLYESCKEDVTYRNQDDENAIRRAMVGWYFLTSLVWPLAAVFGIAYIMTGTAPQVRDKQAAAAAKKLEDDVKRFEDMIRDWNPTDKFANAASYVQDLVDDGVSAVRDGNVHEFTVDVLDEMKTFTKEQVAQLREELNTLKPSLLDARERAERVYVAGRRSTPSTRRQETTYDDFGFSRR